jgi:hypothetical protein
MKGGFYQKSMEAFYLPPKNFWDMAPGSLGYAVPTLLIAFAPRLLKPPFLRTLIP